MAMFPSEKLMGGRFEHIKELAKGQFGEALLVRDRTVTTTTSTNSGSGGKEALTASAAAAAPPSLYVVKRIMAKIMSKAQLQVALGEITTISALRHPGIVRFYQAWKEDSHVHLRMEYCDGGDLQQLLKSDRFLKRPLSEPRLSSYIIQILTAVAYMHDHHVIHRDLKLANIFLTDRQALVKIGDFGLSKLLNTTDEAAKTQAGTPYYFSPEIAAGEDYTTKTDIFSLGVLFYELMTRRKPFDGRSIAKVLHATRFQATPDIRAVVEQQWHFTAGGKHQPPPSSNGDGKPPPTPSLYSETLYRMVAWMLEKDPARRPTAAQLLGSVQTGTPSTASTTSKTATAPASATLVPKNALADSNTATTDSNSHSTGHPQHLMLAQAVVLNVRRAPKMDAPVVGKVNFREQAIITVVDSCEIDNRKERRPLGAGPDAPVPNVLLWYKLIRPLEGWMIADLGNGQPLFHLWQPDAPAIKRPTSPLKPRAHSVNPPTSPLRRCPSALRRQPTLRQPTALGVQPLSPLNGNIGTPRQSPVRGGQRCPRTGGAPPQQLPDSNPAAVRTPRGGPKILQQQQQRIALRTNTVGRDASPPPCPIDPRPFARTTPRSKPLTATSPVTRTLVGRPSSCGNGAEDGVRTTPSGRPLCDPAVRPLHGYRSPVARPLNR